MTDRKGLLWDAMRAAQEVLEVNHAGAMSGKAYNANVSPIIDLTKKIVEECAKIGDEHAKHEHASSADFIEGYKQAAESIAATLRAKIA